MTDCQICCSCSAVSATSLCSFWTRRIWFQWTPSLQSMLLWTLAHWFIWNGLLCLRLVLAQHRHLTCQLWPLLTQMKRQGSQQLVLQVQHPTPPLHLLSQHQWLQYQELKHRLSPLQLPQLPKTHRRQTLDPPAAHQSQHLHLQSQPLSAHHQANQHPTTPTQPPRFLKPMQTRSLITHHR